MAEKKIPLFQLTDLNMERKGVQLFRFSDDALSDHHITHISAPHRHDHYCCFLIEDGFFDFSVDFQLLHLRKKTLLISYPGQVHQYIASKKCTSIGLLFDAKFVDEKVKMIIEESMNEAVLLFLDKESLEWFQHLTSLLEHTLQENSASHFQEKMVRSLLDAFLYKSTLIYQQQENKRLSDYSSRNIEITKTFRQLLRKNFKVMKKPSEYAEQMNISVSYLNDTVKAVTGFSLSYFIQQEIMTEAQRLLFYTELSIKEIAYALGFEDDKYFIRLFGKTTGSSPSTFRKNKSTQKS